MKKKSLLLTKLQQGTHSRALALLFAFATASSLTNAEDSDNTSAQPDNHLPNDVLIVPSLQVITADSGSSRVDNSSAEGSYHLDRQSISQLQESSGSITEVLDTVPNIQFSDEHSSADGMSSLKPASVSISGGRFYENNFSVNGISNNSMLDPAGSETSDTSVTDIPGHEQAIFFDVDQLESITVYDSNIPAEYGNFTGGVIDAKIRQPGYETRTETSYFSTHSDWVDYQLIINDDQEDNPTYEPPESPKFSRYRLNIAHERAINDSNSVRFSLSNSQSKTPKLTYNETKDVQEKNLNISVIHGYEDDDLTVTNYFSVSPYEKSTFQEDVKDSGFTLKGGGFSANSDSEFYHGNQTHNLTLAANYSINARTAPTHFYNWANSKSCQWGLDAGETSSREGGFGDMDKYQASISANWKITMPLQHSLLKQWTYGTTINQSFAGFERPQDTYIHNDATINTAVQCVGQTTDCVQGEQYFRERKIYPEDSVGVSLTQLAGYSELTLGMDKFETTLGFRLDYENFLKNTNIAWRSRMAYDWFGDNSLVLTAGSNRYYGGPLLTYKLRQAAKPFYQEYRGTTNNIVNPWEYDSETGNYRYDISNVKTPYSDELTLGTKFLLLSGTAEVKAVSRNNENEFSRQTTAVQPDGYRYYRLNNNGYSSYESIFISWDRSNADYSYGFNTTWSKTKSSNDTYDDNVDAATSDADVWYNNQRRTLSEINQLRQNFARPLIATLYAHVPVHKQLTASVKGRYKGTYTTVVRGRGTTFTGIVDNDGVNAAEYLDNYEDVSRQSVFLVDTTLRWQPFTQTNITLISELKNLFNRRTFTVTDEDNDGIEVGRSYWLGIEAAF